jgi:hypothetical protein
MPRLIHHFKLIFDYKQVVVKGTQRQVVIYCDSGGAIAMIEAEEAL